MELSKTPSHMDKAFNALSQSARKAGLTASKADSYARQILANEPTITPFSNGDHNSNEDNNINPELNYTTCVDDGDINSNQQSLAFYRLAENQILLGQRVWFKLPGSNTKSSELSCILSPQHLQTIHPDMTKDLIYASGRVQCYQNVGQTSASLRVGVVIDALDKFLWVLNPEQNSGPSFIDLDGDTRTMIYHYCLSLGCNGTYKPRGKLSPTPQNVNVSTTLNASGNSISTNNHKYFQCEPGHGFYFKMGEVYAPFHIESAVMDGSVMPSCNDEDVLSLSSFSSVPASPGDLIDDEYNTTISSTNTASIAPRAFKVGDRVAIRSSGQPATNTKPCQTPASKTNSVFGSISSGIDQLLRSESLCSLYSTMSTIDAAGRPIKCNSTPSALKIGTIRYIGPIHVSKVGGEEWVGVQLDYNIGKNDGRIGDQRYFKCKPNYGLFVRSEKIVLLSEDQASEFKRRISSNRGLTMSAIATQSVKNLKQHPHNMLERSYSGRADRSRKFSTSSMHLTAAATPKKTQGGLSGSRESLASQASFMSLKPHRNGNNATFGVFPFQVQTPNSNGHIANPESNVPDKLVTPSDLNTVMKLRLELDRCRRQLETQKGEIIHQNSAIIEKTSELNQCKAEYVSFKSKTESDISDLFNQIEDFEKQNEDLENKLAEEKSKCENYQFQMEELAIQVQDKSQREDTSQTTHSTEATASESNSSIEDEKGITDETFNDNSKLELLELKQALEDKESEGKALFEQNQTLKVKLENLEKDWLSTSQELKMLRETNDKLVQELESEKMSHNEILTATNAKISQTDLKNVATMNEFRETVSGQIKDFQNKVCALEEEIAHRDTLITEAERRLQIISASEDLARKELKNDMKQAQNLAAEWETRFNEIKSKNDEYFDDLQHANQEFQRRLDESRDTLAAEAQTKISQVSQKLEIEHLRKENEYLSKITILERGLAQGHDAIKTIKNEMEICRNNYEHKDSEVQKSIELNYVLTENFQKAQCDFDKLQNRYNGLDREYKNLEKEIDRLNSIMSNKDKELAAANIMKLESEGELSGLREKIDLGLLVDISEVPSAFRDAIKNPNTDSGSDFKDLTSLNTTPENMAQIHKQCHEKQIFLGDVIIDMNEQLNKLHKRIKDMAIVNNMEDKESHFAYQQDASGSISPSNKYPYPIIDSLNTSHASNIKLGTQLPRPSNGLGYLIDESYVKSPTKYRSQGPSNDKINGEAKDTKISPRKFRTTVHQAPADLLFDAIASKALAQCVNSRLYCDNCETFDIHDTSKCPDECYNYDNERTKDAVVPQTKTNKSVKNKLTSNTKAPPPPRKYCDTCEAFGHDTEECLELRNTSSNLHFEIPITNNTINVSDIYI